MRLVAPILTALALLGCTAAASAQAEPRCYSGWLVTSGCKLGELTFHLQPSVNVEYEVRDTELIANPPGGDADTDEVTRVQTKRCEPATERPLKEREGHARAPSNTASTLSDCRGERTSQADFAPRECAT
jgi:hypothetical protein